MLISCDQKRAHLRSYDSSGKRSLILGLTWLLYNLGSYLDFNEKLLSETDLFQPTTVQMWQVGLRIVFLLVLTNIVYFYSRPSLPALALSLAPCLVICTLMGAALKTIDNVNFDLNQDHRSISLLQNSEKVIGEARVIDHRQSNQSCIYTFVIQNVQKPS